MLKSSVCIASQRLRNGASRSKENVAISAKKELGFTREIMSNCSLSIQYVSFYSLEQTHFKFIHENTHKKKKIL